MLHMIICNVAMQSEPLTHAIVYDFIITVVSSPPNMEYNLNYTVNFVDSVEISVLILTGLIHCIL